MDSSTKKKVHQRITRYTVYKLTMNVYSLVIVLMLLVGHSTHVRCVIIN